MRESGPGPCKHKKDSKPCSSMTNRAYTCGLPTLNMNYVDCTHIYTYVVNNLSKSAVLFLRRCFEKQYTSRYQK